MRSSSGQNGQGEENVRAEYSDDEKFDIEKLNQKKSSDHSSILSKKEAKMALDN